MDLYSSFLQSIDDKNRISIPSQFRPAIKATIEESTERIAVLTEGTDGAIFVFSKHDWPDQRKRFPFLDLPPREYVKFMRKMNASAADCTVDGQSRIKIPQHLIDYAGLDKEVFILGMGDHFELWKPETYKAYIADKPGDTEKFESNKQKVFIEMEKDIKSFKWSPDEKPTGSDHQESTFADAEDSE